MKKIIVSVSLFVAIVSGCSYYYFIGTPTYSLYEIKMAIKNHDTEKFKKYVDIDSITDKLLDEASKKMDTSDDTTGALSGLKALVISAMRPAIKNAIEKSIENEDNSEVKFTIKRIDKNKDTATAIVESSKGGEMTLLMKKTPSRYWRIVGIDSDSMKNIK